MKHLVCGTVITMAALAQAAPPQPPPLYQDTSPPPRTASPTGQYVYQQKPLAVRPVLVTADQATTIMNRFKAGYTSLGKPRFLVLVNPGPPHDQGTGTNSPATTEGKPATSMADKQTMRDLERLFGRPLRNGGASLADQQAGRELVGDKPLTEFLKTNNTPQAASDRAALQGMADVVIETLVSSRDITVPTVTGDLVIAIPDIQATAIRLSDAKVIGQASSTDITSRVPPATLRYFDVREITEATALALMEDMLTGVK